MIMSRELGRSCKSKTIKTSQTFLEIKAIKKQIHDILAQDECDRSEEDRVFLKQNRKYAKSAEASKKYQSLKKDRELEVEDEDDSLQGKCHRLFQMIQESKKIVIYTGAGISTSASIPDYRGPNGVWTQLNKGYETPKVTDLVFAEPTYTHLAITELVRKKIVHHVVSQNCDGLHIRSGMAQRSLSEIHGNMYLEVCKNCKSQYWRTFDVTERTSLRRHLTGRFCQTCPRVEGQPTLIDTIVHFGERGKLKNPLNWDAATRAANEADLIICLGTSLKVLRTYHCLWPKKGSVKLVIVNLQWTPKDSVADMKINGKCDDVMRHIMESLELVPPGYERAKDAIFLRATPLTPEEEPTCSRIKMEQLLEIKKEEDEEEMPVAEPMTPGWFGKGLKTKVKPSKSADRQPKIECKTESPAETLIEVKSEE